MYPRVDDRLLQFGLYGNGPTAQTLVSLIQEKTDHARRTSTSAFNEGALSLGALLSSVYVTRSEERPQPVARA